MSADLLGKQKMSPRVEGVFILWASNLLTGRVDVRGVAAFDWDTCYRAAQSRGAVFRDSGRPSLPFGVADTRRRERNFGTLFPGAPPYHSVIAIELIAFSTRRIPQLASAPPYHVSHAVELSGRNRGPVCLSAWSVWDLEAQKNK